MSSIKLDLNEDQEKAYHSLLAFGQLSVGEFCFYNNFEHKSGLEMLTVLEEKGLAVPIKGLSNRYIPRFPFLNISEKFKEPVEKFNTITKELGNFFDEKEKSVKESLDAKIKEMNEAIDPKIKELEDSEKSLKSEVDKRKSEFSSDIETSETSFRTKFEESIAQSTTEFNGKKDTTVETAFNKSTEKKDVVLQESKTFLDSTASLSTEFFSNIDNTIQIEIQKNYDDLKTSISELNTELEDYEKNFEEESTKFIGKSLTDSENHLNKIKEDFNELISKTKLEISLEKEALGILNLETQDLSSFESNDSKIKQPLIELRDLLLKSKSEVKSFKEKFENTVQEIIGNDKSAMLEAVESTKSEISNLVVKFKEDSTAQDEYIKRKINETEESNNTKSTEMFTSEVSKIDEQKKIGKKSIASIKSAISEKHSKASIELDSNISNLVDNVLPEMSSNITKWQGQFTSTFDGIKESVTKESNDMVTTLQQFMDELKSQHDSNSTGVKDWATKIKSSFDELVTIMEGNLLTLISSQQNNINTKVTTYKEQLPVTLDKNISKLKSSDEQVSSELKKLHELLQVQLNTSKSLLENHKQSVLTELPEKLNLDLDTLTEYMNNHTESLATNLNSFQNEWASLIKVFTEKWVSLQDEASQNKQTSLTETHTKFNTAFEAFSTNSTNLREKFSIKSSELISENSQNIDSVINQTSSHLEKGYNEVISEQESNLDNLLEKNAGEHDAHLSSIKDNYESVKSLLKTFITNIRTSTNTIFENRQHALTTSSESNKTIYEENKAKLVNEFESTRDKTFKNLDEKNSAYYDEMLFLQNTLLNEIGQIVNNFQNNLSDLTANQMKELLASLQDKFNYVTGVQGLISDNIKGFITTENDIREQITNGIDEQAKILSTNIKEHVSEIEKLVKIGEELLTPSSTLLDEFDQIIKNYNFPEIISAVLIGHSASIMQIEEMLKSMKNSITLLIPNPADIPLERIAEFKRPKRIELFSQFDFEKNEHKTFGKRLLGQDNVTLYNIKIRPGGLISEFPPVLAVEVDNEEVLFGTQDPKKKTEFVGMRSRNDEFVNFIGNVVISDFRSKSRKVKQDEL